ncbi:MAG: hypothetical protein D6724_02590 [Armatimonadetes bacterium]|nr:MAG: hypothetical protein D6724_02590 [Armatimonadota bacterium]
MNRIAVLIAAFVAVPTACFAQADWTDVPLQFSLRAGAFAPTENDLQDLDNVWFAAGADVELMKGFLTNADTVISLDWFSRNGGSDSNVFPLMFSQRWYQGSWPNRTYFHVGIGPVFTDFRPADVVFGARGGFGFEASDRLFFEANFYWSDEVTQGFNVIGGAGFVGVRF